MSHPDPKSGMTPEDENVEYVPADDAIIGTAFKWSLIVLVGAGALVGGFFLLQGDDDDGPVVIDRERITGPRALDQEEPERPDVTFTDVTEAWGIDFVHESAARGGKLLPETMGSGCAVFDYDGDGDQDLLFLSCPPWPGDAPRADASTTSRLYANDGSGSFTDVTAEAGLAEAFYATGVAVADYDGDADPDLFIAALGANRLYRNDGGRFVDVSADSGLQDVDASWSTSAGFADIDNDGWLDLFVCNYVQWSAEIDRELNFSLNGVDRAYGPPKQYRGADCRLFRNRGDGTFSDITESAGIAVRNPATDQPMSKALAVTFADLDHDGSLDILVANDTVQNFLFHNRGDGTFDEIGSHSGVGFDSGGMATGAMGMDLADFANAGNYGIGIGNFSGENTSFYVQQRDRLQFADMSGTQGIGSPSRLKLSFGLFFFDYDLDGRLDMLQANGHLEEEINEIEQSQHYEQPTQLFWNNGRGTSKSFVAVPEDEMGALGTPVVGRGAAYGDLDGDGDLDVVITQPGRAALVFRNDQALGHHWLRVRVEGTGGNRDAIGSWVALRSGDTTQRQQVMPARSYLSSVERTVTFGLGEATSVDALTITWPDGTEQVVDVDGIDQEIVVTRGSAS